MKTVPKISNKKKRNSKVDFPTMPKNLEKKIIVY